MPTMTAAIAAFDATSPLGPYQVERRDPGPHDVAIDILNCGICHSDIHIVRGEVMPVEYPLVPGHEIIGRVSAVGKDVARHKVGDLVGVGCLVESCRDCDSCHHDLENYCTGGSTFTYGTPDPYGGGITQGGYSKAIVVNEDFVLSVPENLDPAAAAPLLCAGITTWSPLRHWAVDANSRVGVVGLGGLGHMAIKLASALGAEVTAFTTTPAKADQARRLGAAKVVVSKDEEAMAQQAGSLDLTLDTVSASHALDPYINALARDGVHCLLGVATTPHPPPNTLGMIFGRKSVAGSLIGGLKETQELLDFCGQHNITAEIEKVRMDQVNQAWERMLRGDVRFRFVIGMDAQRAG